TTSTFSANRLPETTGSAAADDGPEHARRVAVAALGRWPWGRHDQVRLLQLVLPLNQNRRGNLRRNRVEFRLLVVLGSGKRLGNEIENLIVLNITGGPDYQVTRTKVLRMIFRCRGVIK